VNGSLSDIEDQLRAAYRAAADTVDPDGIRSMREPMTVIAPGRTRRARGRRAARGRILIPLAAAAAIVAVAAGVPALLSGRMPAAPGPTGGAGPAPSSPASPTARATALPERTRLPATLTIPPGAPPFFVTTDGGPGTTLHVYQTDTARPVGQVTVPHPGDDFYAAAATADPLRYVVAVGHAYKCGTRLYTLRLRPDGQSAGYTPLRVPTLPEDVSSLAVTPDARSLAYAGEFCTDPSGGQGDVGYVNLATGAISRWTAPKQQDIGSLSLSASGSEIGFAVGATKLFPAQAGLLATDAPTGTLAERAQVIVSATQLTPAGTVPEGAMLSPRGRTMYVCGAGVSVGSKPPPATPDPLLTYSGATLTHTAHLAGGGSCGLSLDPSGRFLLAQTSGGYGAGAGTPALQLIDLATGKATSLPVPAASLLQDEIFW
jgi:hypothetical protein